MKAKTITYWITTAIVAFVMTISGTLAAVHAPAMMKALAHLGYPAYFANIIGIAKLAGVCILLAPGYALVKEWTYAGFEVVVVSAIYSHVQSGDGLLALDPLVVLAMLLTSYFTRPANRRLVITEHFWRAMERNAR